MANRMGFMLSICADGDGSGQTRCRPSVGTREVCLPAPVAVPCNCAMDSSTPRLLRIAQRAHQMRSSRARWLATHLPASMRPLPTPTLCHRLRPPTSCCPAGPQIAFCACHIAAWAIHLSTASSTACIPPCIARRSPHRRSSGPLLVRVASGSCKPGAARFAARHALPGAHRRCFSPRCSCRLTEAALRTGWSDATCNLSDEKPGELQAGWVGRWQRRTPSLSLLQLTEQRACRAAQLDMRNEQASF